jgi:glycosyltransferase 2 family protein
MNALLRRIVPVLLLGVLVYGGFVIYTGYQSIGASLVLFDWWAFVAALALACLNYALRFIKWQFYLSVLGIRGIAWVDSLLIFLSGFVLTITPGKVGEVFKSAVMARTHNVEAERTAPIVVAERLTDLIAIVILIVCTSSSLADSLMWPALGAVAIGCGFVAIYWRAPMEWLFRRESPAFARIVPRLRKAYEQLQVLSSPSRLLLPVFVSVLAWAAEGFALYVLIAGFGEHTSVAGSMFFYSTATLAGALVPIPGGLGITETLMREQLLVVGKVSLGAATASMLLVRFATLWWAVLVGFGALAILRLRFPVLTGADVVPPAPQRAAS